MAGIPTEASIYGMVEKAMPGRLRNVYCGSAGGGKYMAVQEVKKNAWYEKERLNMEEHLSTDASDPISVIKDYIRSHLSDPELGRTSIAEKIHMNPDYLSHIFSTKTGASLSSYIMDERMTTAKRLLATTSFSPQQICDQIGIANVSYFYRQFKKSSGVTPQQYREKHFHG